MKRGLMLIDRGSREREAEEEGHEEHARVFGKAKGTDVDEKGLNLHSTFLGGGLKTTFFFNTNKSLFGVPAHEHHEEEHEDHEEEHEGTEAVQLNMKRNRVGFEVNKSLSGNFENFRLFRADFWPKNGVFFRFKINCFNFINLVTA